MQNDIEALYRRSLPDFVRVLPDGFQFAGQIQTSLEVSIQDEQLVRKLWDHGRLLCQSIDGFSSLTTGKPCRVCRHQSRCTPQIVLYVLVGDTPCRVALNHTSAQNYFNYRRRLLDQDHQPAGVLTVLTVASHDTWGEIQFRELF
jgi:hypothetical protein